MIQTLERVYGSAERTFRLTSCIEAFRLLTAIPLPSSGEGCGERLDSSIAWFPLVGAALGAALLVVDWGAEQALPTSSPLIRSALELTVYALLTGGIHHDALVDATDAFWGAREREARLRIMKDSRAGALGVTALSLFLLLEFSSLQALSESKGMERLRWRWAAFLSFPVLGRWAMSYLCVRFPSARLEGAGAAVAGRKRPGAFLISTSLTAAVLVFAHIVMSGVPLLAPSLMLLDLLLAELLGGYFSRSLGGVNGDIIGATGMLCEMLVLLLLAGSGAKRHVRN